MKRYDYDEWEGSLDEFPDGEYCKCEDVEKLEAQNERLMEALSDIAKMGEHTDYIIDAINIAESALEQ